MAGVRRVQGGSAAGLDAREAGAGEVRALWREWRIGVPAGGLRRRFGEAGEPGDSGAFTAIAEEPGDDQDRVGGGRCAWQFRSCRV